MPGLSAVVTYHLILALVYQVAGAVAPEASLCLFWLQRTSVAGMRGVTTVLALSLAVVAEDPNLKTACFNLCRYCAFYIDYLYISCTCENIRTSYFPSSHTLRYNTAKPRQGFNHCFIWKLNRGFLNCSISDVTLRILEFDWVPFYCHSFRGKAISCVLIKQCNSSFVCSQLYAFNVFFLHVFQKFIQYIFFCYSTSFWCLETQG